jgi:hypothetical protein
MISKYKIEQLSYSAVNGNDDTYFLLLNNRRYYVGYLVIEILELLHSHKSYREIALELNKNHDTDYFNESSIQQTIEEDFVKKGILKDESQPEMEKPSMKQYIYFRVNFLKSQNYPGLLRVLSTLFIPKVFWVTFIGSIIIAALFLTGDNLRVVQDLNVYGTSMLVLVFIFSVINTLWHELGHAAATYRNKVMPKDIGFGFYIVYPIFFTDVSDIWKLSNKQRNIVNLGGIYFQMIANIVLIALYYISPAFWITPTLVLFNTGVAFISLNPFFRYDGYWIYSDFFNLPNLREQANLFFKAFLKKLVGNKEKTWKELFSKPIPLIIYAFASNLFFLWIWTMLAWGCVIQVQAIAEIAGTANATGWSKDSISAILSRLPAIGIFLVFIVWMIRNRRKGSNKDS